MKAKWKNERKELKVKLTNECNMKRKWKEMKGNESNMKKWAKGNESKIQQLMQHEEKIKGNERKWKEMKAKWKNERKEMKVKFNN